MKKVFDEFDGFSKCVNLYEAESLSPPFLWVKER